MYGFRLRLRFRLKLKLHSGNQFKYLNSPEFGISLLNRKVKQRDSSIRNSAFKIYKGVKLIKVIPFFVFFK